MPDQVFFDAARKPPALGQAKQRAEVGFLSHAEVDQNGAGLNKSIPALQMGTEAIALLPPKVGVNRLAGFEQRSSQDRFFLGAVRWGSSGEIQGFRVWGLRKIAQSPVCQEGQDLCS